LTFVKYGEAKSKPNTEDLTLTLLYKICFYRTEAKDIFFTGNLIVIEMHSNMTA